VATVDLDGAMPSQLSRPDHAGSRDRQSVGLQDEEQEGQEGRGDIRQDLRELIWATWPLMVHSSVQLDPSAARPGRLR
jgi:hypothetical protein